MTQACVVHAPPSASGGEATRSSPRSSAATRLFDGGLVVGVGEERAVGERRLDERPELVLRGHGRLARTWPRSVIAAAPVSTAAAKARPGRSMPRRPSSSSVRANLLGEPARGDLGRGQPRPSPAATAWAPRRPRAGPLRRRTAAAGRPARARRAHGRPPRARPRRAARAWDPSTYGSVVTTQSGSASSNWITISWPRAVPTCGRPRARPGSRLTSVATGADARSSSARRSAAASSSSAKRARLIGVDRPVVGDRGDRVEQRVEAVDRRRDRTRPRAAVAGSVAAARARRPSRSTPALVRSSGEQIEDGPALDARASEQGLEVVDGRQRVAHRAPRGRRPRAGAVRHARRGARLPANPACLRCSPTTSVSSSCSTARQSAPIRAAAGPTRRPRVVT